VGSAAANAPGQSASSTTTSTTERLIDRPNAARPAELRYR
jgi:hypothetical protein